MAWHQNIAAGSWERTKRNTKSIASGKVHFNISDSIHVCLNMCIQVYDGHFTSCRFNRMLIFCFCCAKCRSIAEKCVPHVRATFQPIINSFLSMFTSLSLSVSRCVAHAFCLFIYWYCSSIGLVRLGYVYVWIWIHHLIEARTNLVDSFKMCNAMP